MKLLLLYNLTIKHGLWIMAFNVNNAYVWCLILLMERPGWENHQLPEVIDNPGY
jgi:hypothetical protein